MFARSSRAAVLAVAVVLLLGGAMPTPPTAAGQITIKFVWDKPPLKPVFDCENSEVRRKYPAQCPEAPIFLGGGSGGAPGGGSSCGLCDLIGDVLGSIPGLGGIL